MMAQKQKNTSKLGDGSLTLKLLFTLLFLSVGLAIMAQNKNVKVSKETNGIITKSYDYVLESRIRIDDETEPFSPGVKTNRVPVYQARGGQIEIKVVCKSGRCPKALELTYSTLGLPFERKQNQVKKIDKRNKTLIIPLKGSGKGSILVKFAAFPKDNDYKNIRHAAIQFDYHIIDFQEQLRSSQGNIIQKTELLASHRSFQHRDFDNTKGVEEIRRYINNFRKATEASFQNLQKNIGSSEKDLKAFALFTSSKLEQQSETRGYPKRAKKILNDLENKEWAAAAQSRNIETIRDFQNKYANLYPYRPIISISKMEGLISEIKAEGDAADKERNCQNLLRRVEELRPSAATKKNLERYLQRCQDWGCSGCSEIEAKLNAANGFFMCNEKLTLAKNENDIKEKLSLLKQIMNICYKNEYGKEAKELYNRYQFAVESWKELGRQSDPTTGKNYWKYIATFENGNNVNVFINNRPATDFEPSISINWTKPDRIMEVIINEFEEAHYELSFRSQLPEKVLTRPIYKEDFNVVLSPEAEALVISLKSEGIPPYFLQFEGIDNDQVFFIPIGIKEGVKKKRIPTADLSKAYQGKFAVNVVDNYGRKGIKEMQVPQIELKGERSLSLWIYLILPLLLLTGFLSYRNIRFSQA